MQLSDKIVYFSIIHCFAEGRGFEEAHLLSSFWAIAASEICPYILRKNIMLYTIAVVLIILWLLGFFAFHVMGGIIHILLVIAVIMIILNLVRGRRAL
jgi:hypothetical protein